MSTVEGLLRAYERFVRLPWERNLPGPQKVWFAIYEPVQERRLRLRLTEFQLATQGAGHGWRHVDLTDAFAAWMSAHEYRDAYFADPEAMETELRNGFATSVTRRVTDALAEVDDDTVVAVSGAASLFGLTRVSALVERVAPRVRGRLLVFFPGHYQNSNYRLLDARDGWNYQAVPITADDGD